MAKKPPKPSGNQRALVIGVSDYPNQKFCGRRPVRPGYGEATTIELKSRALWVHEQFQ